MNRKLLIVIASVCFVIVSLLMIKIISPDNNIVDKSIDWVTNSNSISQIQDGLTNKQQNATTSTSDGSIKISSPAPNSKVKPGFEVKGSARVAENLVSWKLITSGGELLGQGDVIVDVNDELNTATFEFMVLYPENTAGNGYFEMFDYSLKDGSLYEKIQIPLSFN